MTLLAAINLCLVELDAARYQAREDEVNARADGDNDAIEAAELDQEEFSRAMRTLELFRTEGVQAIMEVYRLALLPTSEYHNGHTHEMLSRVHNTFAPVSAPLETVDD